MGEKNIQNGKKESIQACLLDSLSCYSLPSTSLEEREAEAFLGLLAEVVGDSEHIFSQTFGRYSG